MSARSRSKAAACSASWSSTSSAAPSAKGTVILGNCFPGIPVLENRAKGVQESLKVAAGLNVIGPFDVKVSAVDNYNAGSSSMRANPDAVALIGLCAPDITSLGKLNAANGDKFVAGGYDMTELNLKAIKEGHAYVTIGQSAYRAGLSADRAARQRDPRRQAARSPASTMPDRRWSRPTSVDMGNGLPKISFDEAMKLAADPAATAAYYKPWSDTLTADMLAAKPAADLCRIGVRSRPHPAPGGRSSRPPSFFDGRGIA